jgi:hypothetical protein
MISDRRYAYQLIYTDRTLLFRVRTGISCTVTRCQEWPCRVNHISTPSSLKCYTTVRSTIYSQSTHTFAAQLFLRFQPTKIFPSLRAQEIVATLTTPTLLLDGYLDTSSIFYCERGLAVSSSGQELVACNPARE